MRTNMILPAIVGVVYLFLYLPIAVLVFFSFNKNAVGFYFDGFTLEWYRALFSSPEVWHALKNSLIVATSATTICLLCSLSYIYYSKRTIQKALIPFFYVNIAIPEIVLAVGLLTFFYFFSIPLGLTSLIAAHSVLGLGYVLPILFNRFEDLDENIIEASLDLGATKLQTLRKVIIPMLMPAMVSGALLVFIISFDDFILSFFCAGASAQTLPLFIFSQIRSGASPIVSALATVLLVISTALVLLFLSQQSKETDII